MADREVNIKLTIPSMKDVDASVGKLNKALKELKGIVITPQLDMTNINGQLESIRDSFSKDFKINISIGNLSAIERQLEDLRKKANITVTSSTSSTGVSSIPSSVPRTTTQKRGTSISMPIEQEYKYKRVPKDVLGKSELWPGRINNVYSEDPARVFDFGISIDKKQQEDYKKRYQELISQFGKFANAPSKPIPVRHNSRINAAGKIGFDTTTLTPEVFQINPLHERPNTFEHESTHWNLIDEGLKESILKKGLGVLPKQQRMNTSNFTRSKYNPKDILRALDKFPNIKQMTESVIKNDNLYPEDALHETLAVLTSFLKPKMSESIKSFRGMESGYFNNKFFTDTPVDKIKELIHEFDIIAERDTDDTKQSHTNKQVASLDILSKKSHLSTPDNLLRYIKQKSSSVGGSGGSPPPMRPGYSTSTPGKWWSGTAQESIDNAQRKQDDVLKGGHTPSWETDRIEFSFGMLMGNQEEFLNQFKQMRMALLPITDNIKYKKVGVNKQGQTFAKIKFLTAKSIEDDKEITDIQTFITKVLDDAKVILQKDPTGQLSGINNQRVHWQNKIPKESYGYGNKGGDLFRQQLQPINLDWGRQSVDAHERERQKRIAMLTVKPTDTSTILSTGKAQGDYGDDLFRGANLKPFQIGWTDAQVKAQQKKRAQQLKLMTHPDTTLMGMMGHQDLVGRQNENYQNYLAMGLSDKKQYTDPVQKYLSPLYPKQGMLKTDGDDMKKKAQGIGGIIDSLASKSGVLGRMSWTFTSLAMSSLGVYFSLMGLVTMLQKGIGMVTGPLANTEALITSIAMAQTRGTGMQTFLTKMGMSMADVVEGARRYQWAMSSVQGALGTFGAKLMLNKDVWKAIQDIVQIVYDTLSDPAMFDLMKGIILAFRDNLPGIINAVKFIGGIIKDWVIPNAGALAFLWTMSLVAMPVLSIMSSIASMAKGLATVLGVAKGLYYVMTGVLTVTELINGVKVADKLASRGKETGQTILIPDSSIKAQGLKAGLMYAGAFLAGLTIGVAVVNIMDSMGITNQLQNMGATFKEKFSIIRDIILVTLGPALQALAAIGVGVRDPMGAAKAWKIAGAQVNFAGERIASGYNPDVVKRTQQMEQGLTGNVGDTALDQIANRNKDIADNTKDSASTLDKLLELFKTPGANAASPIDGSMASSFNKGPNSSNFLKAYIAKNGQIVDTIQQLGMGKYDPTQAKQLSDGHGAQLTTPQTYRAFAGGSKAGKTSSEGLAYLHPAEIVLNAQDISELNKQGMLSLQNESSSISIQKQMALYLKDILKENTEIKERTKQQSNTYNQLLGGTLGGSGVSAISGRKTNTNKSTGINATTVVSGGGGFETSTPITGGPIDLTKLNPDAVKPDAGKYSPTTPYPNDIEGDTSWHHPSTSTPTAPSVSYYGGVKDNIIGGVGYGQIPTFGSMPQNAAGIAANAAAGGKAYSGPLDVFGNPTKYNSNKYNGGVYTNENLRNQLAAANGNASTSDGRNGMSDEALRAMYKARDESNGITNNSSSTNTAWGTDRVTQTDSSGGYDKILADIAIKQDADAKAAEKVKQDALTAAAKKKSDDAARAVILQAQAMNSNITANKNVAINAENTPEKIAARQVERQAALNRAAGFARNYDYEIPSDYTGNAKVDPARGQKDTRLNAQQQQDEVDRIRERNGLSPLSSLTSNTPSMGNLLSNNINGVRSVSGGSSASSTNKNVTVNITINGNADSSVTDDMIRKIKRELFGHGV
jgi:hypothetical protein